MGIAYSLFEPFEWAGIEVCDRDALTALPEYRNGGLLLDSGVITWLAPGETKLAWDVGSELVVEWRASTVALIDELAPRVRASLGVADLPPFAVRSDGTVF